ncbi:hypothetical protein [Paenibacillus hunanensis]|uniref:DUF3169 domain-containing protein n=1 Tax=Paenibacillus hunanensis TaxID=539262 RepID=A0ABU1IW88_9BACL|nr:hypothetical protein [Paenibacillus hunanensis]MDR6243527.1 hypothetical protein [Paenibacillus hunanensis]GGI98383.1 hypothetical protein GCM10008022_03910 [Paenibacillus hunanensis]
MNSGRWWEYYLVRYFVGTIVGTLIVMHLSTQEGIFIHEILYEKLKFNKDGTITTSNLIIFGFVGLTFCYLASAPILLLHALRSNLQSGFLRNILRFSKNIIYLKYTWKDCEFIRKLLFIVGTIAIIVIAYFVIFKFLEPSNIKIYGFWSSITICIVFSLQISYIFYQLIKRDIYDFYKKLASKRARQITASQEYVESYRHLREHGNAFFIVFCEMILGFIYSTVNSVTTAFVYTLLWIIPVCSVWFIGSYLEMKFKNS